MGKISIGSQIPLNKSEKEIIGIRLCNDGTTCQQITEIKVESSSLIGRREECLPIKDAIKQIEENETEFFTFNKVAEKCIGKKYLRTESNNTKDDNLLNLPRF